MPNAGDAVPFPTKITAEQLFESMDGVAYVAAPDGTILAIAEGGWSRFAAENAVSDLRASSVVGASLFGFMRGEQVRAAYRRLHAAVAERRRPQIAFEYRCDSPIAERHMRMAISPILDEGEIVALLYQSQIIFSVERPPIPLFSAETLNRKAADGSDWVLLCAFCQRVAWPAGRRDRVHWITPQDFYRLGGPGDAQIEHTVCARCTRVIVDANA